MTRRAAWSGRRRGERDARELAARADAELLEDAREDVGDGAGREREPGGDLGVREPLGGGPGDGGLARAERRRARTGGDADAEGDRDAAGADVGDGDLAGRAAVEEPHELGARACPELARDPGDERRDGALGDP